MPARVTHVSKLLQIPLPLSSPNLPLLSLSAYTLEAMKSIVVTLSLASYIGSAVAYPNMAKVLADRDAARLKARGVTAFPTVGPDIK